MSDGFTRTSRIVRESDNPDGFGEQILTNPSCAHAQEGNLISLLLTPSSSRTLARARGKVCQDSVEQSEVCGADDDYLRVRLSLVISDADIVWAEMCKAEASLPRPLTRKSYEIVAALGLAALGRSGRRPDKKAIRSIACHMLGRSERKGITP